jgi:hypothetical protein
MNRMAQLLDAAADALDDYRDPFHESFLAQHHVVGDEVLELSTLMAMGTRIMAFALSHPAAAGAALDGATASVVGDAVMEKLDRMLDGQD